MLRTGHLDARSDSPVPETPDMLLAVEWSINKVQRLKQIEVVPPTAYLPSRAEIGSSPAVPVIMSLPVVPCWALKTTNNGSRLAMIRSALPSPLTSPAPLIE